MKRNEYDYTKVYPNRNQPFKIYDDYIDYYGDHILKIRFEDENVRGEHTELEVNRRRLNGKDPFIKDPYQPSICNVCAVGQARARTEDGTKMKPEYNLYTGMVHRCYDENADNHQYYADVEVADEWKCFEDFERTLPEVEGYDLWKANPGQYQLDKDTKQQGVEHKVYSKDTCVFISSTSNNFERDNRRNKESDLPRGVYPSGQIDKKTYIAKHNNTHIATFSDPTVAGYAVALYVDGHGKDASSYFNALPRIPSFDEMVNTRITYKNDHGMYDLYAPNKDLEYDSKINNEE